MQTCPFLERMWQPIEEHTHGCGAALNFYSVGPERALCRTCPVPGLVTEPSCEHLIVYTRLRTNGNGHPYVEAELDCDLWADPSANGNRCEACPLLQTEDGYPLIVDPIARSPKVSSDPRGGAGAD
ncbi:MAG TPA: hypothetical protein EYP04_07565 [Anaerolineae bacterium]|nr:hypothetical protein [Anaerolineae bacterium]